MADDEPQRQRRGRRKAVRLSQMYSFSRLRPPTAAAGGNSIAGGSCGIGYSRLVHCNDPGCSDAAMLGYTGNYVSTTKYTLGNFLPKSLFEQFRRVANMYFLAVAVVSFSPLAPFRAVSVLLPLLIVVGTTMAKEAVEDWRRKQQDIEVNNRKVKVYHADKTFHPIEWKNLRVGDIVMVDKDEFFPADLVLLSSSFVDGICYVETMNLDGETNLKVKQSLEVTVSLSDEQFLENFKPLIKCEDPNEHLYSFVGTLIYEGTEYPLSPQQLLLRDSKLRNTQFIYGVVIFTGHDTKVMQNAMNPPSKRSKVERKMDKIIYVLFLFLAIIAATGSVFFGIETKKDIKNRLPKRWYLRPDDSSVLFDPHRASLAAFLHFLTCLMLYGSLIPISLYISIEIVKVLQSIFINQDLEMYYEEADKPACARTSNLNEELGQVDTVLSDKTGTLTCNSMEFLKCTIAGVAYGTGLSEVEKAVQKRLNNSEQGFDTLDSMDSTDNYPSGAKSVRGYNFKDERLVNGNWAKEPNSNTIQIFLRVMAICHTVIPDIKEDACVSYEAESPDEAALVIASRELGFEFYERTQTSISVHEFDPNCGKDIDRSYELLSVLEFNSYRKRMSVIIRTEEGRLYILCKGADSVMFERLANDERAFENETKKHINSYSQAGLRTLVLAYRELAEDEYNLWFDEFLRAKSSVSEDRNDMVDSVAERIERGLILLGATAVEDKLQKGVSECIDKLAQAGIKIWVLTGDKLETAVNIGYACNLLRKGMKLITISLELPEIIALEKQGDKEAISKASHESITRQINKAKDQVFHEKGSSMGHALVIDGKSLTFALTDDMQRSFLALAISCASVICCRTSPKQKALVTRLVKKGTGKTTLAIGDGANDVGMLQEADIGVGISGVEGMQAVMSSDFAIAQFRFLERLILVHGHWCYRRIAAMICYFFYKNITFAITLFWFEAHASFSAQPAYNDWYISVYSVFFTSLPVVALGVFDKDISARLCLKYPLLHQDGVKNILFSWPRILGWMTNGICCSAIIFYLTVHCIQPQAFQKQGRVGGAELLGATMYTSVVWTVNCQLALYISYFTWIQHLFIWGSILLWYLFLVVYGTFPSTFSTSAYQVFIEACAPSPIYWLTTLAVVSAALLPYFLYSACRAVFFPKIHNIIQTEDLHIASRHQT